jgi:serine/threonine protein kinase
VTELVGGGVLTKHIEDSSDGLEERQVKHIVHQLLKALGFMHSNKIMHRDLKPDNILCQPTATNGLTQVKLTDFGFSK